MSIHVRIGDAIEQLRELESDSVDCVVTSPPYFQLRDYGVVGQLGLESRPELYVEQIARVFEQVHRVLKPSGTVFLNLGDTYTGGTRGEGGPKQRTNLGSDVEPFEIPSGLKRKELIGIPWRVALALQERGWYLRSDIIWHKVNAFPESMRDRPTRAHEYVFLLTRSDRYFWNYDAVKEPVAEGTSDRYAYPFGGTKTVDSATLREREAPADREFRNVRTVWPIPTQGVSDPHYAVMPEELAERCIRAGCPEGGTVLDPFLGSGTTLLVARDLGMDGIGIELNPKNLPIIERRMQAHTVRRLRRTQLTFDDVLYT